MSTVCQSSLTILFEAPFWIGIYERSCNGKYEVCKITFGAEPKDYEVYEFLLKNWHKLKFSPPIQAEVIAEKGQSGSSVKLILTALGYVFFVQKGCTKKVRKIFYQEFSDFSVPVEQICGGEEEIRTLGTLTGTHDFQSCSFGQLGHLSAKTLT